MKVREQRRVFGGDLRFCEHQSEATGTPMRFALYTPPGEGPFPYLVWLSGLTATEENFAIKAGAYGFAAQHGLAILAPDTSPRGPGVPDDPAYDLGLSAGFYLDATQAPWSANYKMESYVTRDLITAAEASFPLDGARRGISGFSMGGHGALTLALKHPDLFRSVSAFAPIAALARCPWGEKALSAYLGPDRGAWRAVDAAALIEGGAGLSFDDILIDQGLADEFLETQLNIDVLEAAAAKAGRKLTLRRHEGYDHSHYFIASFIGDHVAFHARHLIGS